MKIDHNVAAVLLMGFASGAFRNPPTMTSRNRMHIDRARPGSAEETERMAAAAAKRARKAARGARS